ncbi:MAG: 50S ribosomal protein L23 [Candidatus Falkowbacteria bacterium]|nr:50S ribosomal protein L23 [Candidatus Falkowbacteria bacterium]
MALFTKDKPNKTKTVAMDAKPATMKDMYADKAEKTSVKATGTDKKVSLSHAYRILLRPIISEKASRQQTSFNHYFFEVAIKANKIEIAKAVKAAYGITPLEVNVIRMEGKASRRGRTLGKRKDWKKAIVTLPKGKTIALYEGV